MLKIGMIVGSTRPNRFADTPAKWLLDGAAARTDLKLEALNLRDYKLPFFNELTPLGVNVSASSTALSPRSPNTITVPRRFSRTLSTTCPSSGNASPSLLLARVASARPARLRPCVAWLSSYRWRRSSRK
jgi:NADPH-dependent FMN reductase